MSGVSFRTRFACVAALGAAIVSLSLGTGTASAAAYTPSQSDLLSIGTNAGFGAGSIQGNVIDGSGIRFTMTLGSEGGFSRVVPQRNSFEADLSAFSSFDVNVTPLTANVTGLKLYVQTGPLFQYFETPFIGLTQNSTTPVSLTLTGLPNLTAVRQYGIQFFGPPGSFANEQTRVAPVPEPATLAGLFVLAAASLRRRGR
jgi:hypothetical protein